MWPKEKQLLSGNIKIYRWKNSRDHSCQMTQHFTDEEPKPQEVTLPTSQCLISFVDLATCSVKHSHLATFLKHLLCDSGRCWFPAHYYSAHTHSCIASYSKHLQIFAWGLSVVTGICKTLPTSDDGCGWKLPIFSLFGYNNVEPCCKASQQFLEELGCPSAF